MKLFNLKKYVSKHINKLEWSIVEDINLDGQPVNRRDTYFLCVDIEECKIIFDSKENKLYVAKKDDDDRQGFSRERFYTLYKKKLDRIFDFILIKKLNKIRGKLIIDMEFNKMRELPQTILRDYKIDEILDEE